MAQADRRRLADLPGPRRPGARRAAPRLAASPSSTRRASPASTSPATSRRSTSRACRRSAPTWPRRSAARPARAAARSRWSAGPERPTRARIGDAQGPDRQRPADYRQLLAHHVTLEWRDALPAEYEPATRGRLPPGFTGAAYDVVLLDHEVQGGRGLEWLEDLSERPDFPPIVLFRPSRRRAAVVQRACAAGASHVLARGEFEHAATRRRCCARARHGATTCSRTPRVPRASRWRPIASARCGSAATAACAGSPSAARRACSWPSTSATASSACSRSSARCRTWSRAARRSTASCASTNSSRTCDHPNIARIYDIGVADDHLFLAMEYFPGGDLRSRMREPLPWRVALALPAAAGGRARRAARGRRAAPRREAGQRAAARRRQPRVHRLRPGAAARPRERHHRRAARSSARRTT